MDTMLSKFDLCKLVWLVQSPGGYSNYFLMKCAAQGLKPLPLSKDFSHSKNGWIDSFLKFSQNRDPFLRVFLPQKWLILQFFRKFCEMGHSSKYFFFTKMGPMCLRIFGEKVTHLDGTSPYALTCEYPPLGFRVGTWKKTLSSCH